MDTHLSTERYSYYGNTNVNLLSTEELINVITDPEEIKKTTLNTGHVVGWLQASMLKQTYFPSKYPNNFKEMFALLPNYYFLYKNNWWGHSDQIAFFPAELFDRRNRTVRPLAGIALHKGDIHDCVAIFIIIVDVVIADK